MLIYKQKCPNDEDELGCTKALKVGDIAWLCDQWDLNEDYIKFQYSPYAIENACEGHIPTKEDIDKTNIWLKDENNLQAFKNFYHIIRANDENDVFWVNDDEDNPYTIASFDGKQLNISFLDGPIIETIEGQGFSVAKEPLALGHSVVPASECEEIPD